MIFAIHAYETNYCGLHGIEDWGFTEADSENDNSLDEYGRELSRDVIMSYDFLQDEYVEADEEFNPMSDNELDDLINEHLAWEIIPLPHAVSVEECEHLYNETNDPEGVCKRFGE